MRNKIAVIDDDKIILQLVNITLKSEGYEVETFSTTLGSASKLLGFRPDLMLVDINMPGLSGVGLVEVLRKFSKNVALVFYSSMEEDKLKRLAEQQGALGYIHKKTSMTDLINRVKQFLLMAETQDQTL